MSRVISSYTVLTLLLGHMPRKYRQAANKVKLSHIILENDKDHDFLGTGLSLETLWVERHDINIRGLGQNVRGLLEISG